MDKVKIVHVFRNGKQLDSVEGVTVPAGHPIYQYLASLYIGKNKSGVKTSDAKPA